MAADQGDSDSDDETDASELDGYAASNQPKREEKPAVAQPRPAAQPDQGELFLLGSGPSLARSRPAEPARLWPATQARVR